MIFFIITLNIITNNVNNKGSNKYNKIMKTTPVWMPIIINIVMIMILSRFIHCEISLLQHTSCAYGYTESNLRSRNCYINNLDFEGNVQVYMRTFTSRFIGINIFVFDFGDSISVCIIGRVPWHFGEKIISGSLTLILILFLNS